MRRGTLKFRSTLTQLNLNGKYFIGEFIYVLYFW
jgi:hypothetical protein